MTLLDVVAPLLCVAVVGLTIMLVELVKTR